MIIDRLLSKCEAVTESGCWIWTGAVTKTSCGDYGVLNINGRNRYAHRLSLQNIGGVDIENKVVRHKCDNPSCINPAHLVAGTQADNIQDRNDRGRTAKGERASKSKLTYMEVEEIRKSEDSHRALGRRYGVSHSTIGGIKRGEYWRADSSCK